jgi:hypothetical protein
LRFPAGFAVGVGVELLRSKLQRPGAALGPITGFGGGNQLLLFVRDSELLDVQFEAIRIGPRETITQLE